MPEYALHPQTLLMESLWVSQWFQRLLEMDHANQLRLGAEAPKVYIADRSPFSAVFYCGRRTARGHLLDPLIRAQIEELREETGIEVVTVHVNVEPEVLWARIQARLEMEPERQRYNEGSREWMDETLRFYQGFKWDHTVDNSAGTIEELVDEILELLPQLKRQHDAASGGGAGAGGAGAGGAGAGSAAEGKMFEEPETPRDGSAPKVESPQGTREVGAALEGRTSFGAVDAMEGMSVE